MRSDNAAGLDEAGYRALLADGVTRVVDLRGGVPGEPAPSSPTATTDLWS